MSLHSTAVHVHTMKHTAAVLPELLELTTSGSALAPATSGAALDDATGVCI